MVEVADLCRGLEGDRVYDVAKVALRLLKRRFADDFPQDLGSTTGENNLWVSAYREYGGDKVAGVWTGPAPPEAARHWLPECIPCGSDQHAACEGITTLGLHVSLQYSFETDSAPTSSRQADVADRERRLTG